MKTLAVALLLLSTPAIADECAQLHDWITVSDFAVTHSGDSLVFSAQLASSDDRNPADYYMCRAERAEAWQAVGLMRDENGATFSFEESGCSDSIDINPHASLDRTTYALTLTSSRFEFRIPASVLGTGRVFWYDVWFGERSVDDTSCGLAFRGTFDRIGGTSVRRVSLGELKRMYAR